MYVCMYAFRALTLLVGRQIKLTYVGFRAHVKIASRIVSYRRKGIRPTGKQTEWWGSGVVICLERGADLHMAQLMPLPLTVSCFSKIQIGFTFLVPDHPGCPGQMAVKHVCVYVCRLQRTIHCCHPSRGCGTNRLRGRSKAA